MARPAAWWCGLPDTDTARPYADLLRSPSWGGRVVAVHHSGRPWIIMRGEPHRVLVVERPDLTVVVAGRFAGDRDAVLRAVDASGSAGLPPAARVMTALDGCFTTVTTTPDGQGGCGDVVGLSPVFWARGASGVVLLADSAGLLAEVTGRTAVDRVYAAARLAGWAPPSVHARRSPYEAVALVPPGSAIETGRAGERISRAWAFPDDDADLTDAAPSCRDALARALATCPAGRRRVVATVSGGMDSGALAVLGHHLGVVAATLTWEAGHGGEDARHARAVLDRLGGIPHLWIDQDDEMPGAFSGMGRPVPGDEPGLALLAPDSRQFVYRRASDYGDTLVAGHGGDEILTPPFGHLVELARRDRRRALAHLRGYAALDGVRLPVALRRLAEGRGSYPEHLRRWRARLFTAATGTAWGWEPGSATPRWVCRQARELLADAVDSEAGPLHARRHQHYTHAAMTWAAMGHRASAQAARHAGVYEALPFLDRPVLEAFGAVRAEQRRTPYAYKQALTVALADVLPGTPARRRTKSSYSLKPHVDAVAPQVAGLLADSAAARLGLVDPTYAPDALTDVTVDDGGMAPLTRLLATELWLRRLTGPVDAGAVKSDRPDRPARRVTAPAGEAEPPTRAVRFAADVTVVVDDRADDGAVLIRGGRAYALVNAAAVTLARSLAAGTDPVTALRSRFPHTDPDELARAAEAFIDHLDRLDALVRYR
ncbi:asparagine synthase-related protein [Embleya sp. NPDC008237]|uniref:asparagine synthase-related protein n=1 Tax=Embleya sp. NPDC008237 TaxID=3363978 RepID=UPI0036E34F87